MLIRLPYGWPRSWWPQVGHFDQKIKVDQIASYCAMHPRCCSLWLCTFLGLHSSDCDSSACQTILISIGGRTLQCGVMYIFFMFLCYQKWLLSPNVELASQKAYKTTQKKEMCLFVFQNKFENVASNTQFRLAQIRVATFLNFMLQVCHMGKSSHRCAVTLWTDGI